MLIYANPAFSLKKHVHNNINGVLYNLSVLY